MVRGEEFDEMVEDKENEWEANEEDNEAQQRKFLIYIIN